MKLTHGFKGLEITISWSFDILFGHNSWNYFPPAILHMLSRLTTLASVSGQNRYALTLHLRISQTHLSIKCQFIGESKWRDRNIQNYRKFRSKTQWIGSVQPEKFRKTGPPFEVDHFSRSDPSKFWLNGSRPFVNLIVNEQLGQHRRVHRRSILNHHYSATPLNSFQSTWTFNQRRSSQFPLATVTQWESRGTQRQFSENTCSEDDWRSRIFGTFIVKFLACLPLLGFSNI